jgi:hypothetical protein
VNGFQALNVIGVGYKNRGVKDSLVYNTKEKNENI